MIKRAVRGAGVSVAREIPGTMSPGISRPAETASAHMRLEPLDLDHVRETDNPVLIGFTESICSVRTDANRFLSHEFSDEIFKASVTAATRCRRW